VKNGIKEEMDESISPNKVELTTVSQKKDSNLMYCMCITYVLMNIYIGIAADRTKERKKKIYKQN